MNRQQAKSAETRRRILDSALVVIRRDGVRGLTLQRAATEAGVSKGGLLHHFATKDELLQALLDQTMADADRGLEELVGSGEVGAFATAYLEYVRVPRRGPLDSATSVFATAAMDPERLASATAQFEVWQRRLLEHDGLDAVQALLARVVGDGLWLIDLFQLAPPTPEQRGALIDYVLGVVTGSERPSDGEVPGHEEAVDGG